MCGKTHAATYFQMVQLRGYKKEEGRGGRAGGRKEGKRGRSREKEGGREKGEKNGRKGRCMEGG